MSATNRGSERKPCDFYATPVEVVENFLDNYTLPRGNILEPSAGNGNIIVALRNRWINSNITALELREEEEETLKREADEVIILLSILSFSNFLRPFLWNIPSCNFSDPAV